MTFNPDTFLYAVAVFLFVLGGCPTGSRFNFTSWGFAALTLTLLV